MKHLVRIIVAAFLYFIIMAGAFVVLGDDLPDAPAPKTDAVRVEVKRSRNFNRKLFIAGAASLAAASTYDLITTRHLLDRGGYERDPLFGAHPSLAKQLSIGTAFVAGESLAFWFAEHNRHSWVRWIGRGYIAYSIADHVHAGRCNSGIDPSSTSAQKCSPLFF